eukprot:COSAG01_NODE_450_length_16901_cov_7.565476_3_plen_97_part_00
MTAAFDLMHFYSLLPRSARPPRSPKQNFAGFWLLAIGRGALIERSRIPRQQHSSKQCVHAVCFPVSKSLVFLARAAADTADWIWKDATAPQQVEEL